ncbi:MAG: hypothetical protein HQL54_03265 [Magnetococcales bacterium]|nr:hypothetical protein [Magnetococcales bacterium]
MTNKPKLLADSRHMRGRQYLIDKELMTDEVPMKKMVKVPSKPLNIVVPLEIDTEFVSGDIDDFLETEKSRSRTGITVQIKGIHESEGVIYVHPDFERSMMEVSHGDE